MAKIDIHYHELLRLIKDSGYTYTTENRPDITCTQISSITLNVDLRPEFPAVTTKALYFKGVVTELIWFLRGDDNIKYLVDNDVHIWDKDAFKYNQRLYPNQTKDMSMEKYLEVVKENHSQVDGSVGRNYGVQWRDWRQETPVNGVLDTQDSNDYIGKYVDQIDMLITNLRKPNPISRRHIVTAWNPAEIDQTALPPCHWAFEVIPRPLRYFEKIEISGGDRIYLETLWKEREFKTLDKELKDAGVPNYGIELKWHQRSVDTFLGLPFNIASYAVLTHLIAALTDMAPMAIIGDLSNVHIYGPHMEQVDAQLENSPMAYKGTHLKFSEDLQKNIQLYKKGEITLNVLFADMKPEDFILDDYQSFKPLKATMFEPKK